MKKFKIKNRNVKATYYFDEDREPDDIHLSGEVEILSNGQQIYYNDNDGMGAHIEEIEDKILEIEAELVAYKSALILLKRNFNIFCT